MGFSENPVQFDLTNIDIDCSLTNPWVTGAVILVSIPAAWVTHGMFWSRGSARMRIVLSSIALLRSRALARAWGLAVSPEQP